MCLANWAVDNKTLKVLETIVRTTGRVRNYKFCQSLRFDSRFGAEPLHEILLCSGSQDVSRIKFRHTGVAAGNPAEHIDSLGVSDAVRERVGNYFEEGMGCGIFVVVDIWFYAD